MASIVQKKNRYYVVYLYDTEDGKRKQKWESFRTKDEAKRRKAEIEYRQELGSLVIPKCKTVEELLREYVSLYGKNTWSMSMYESSTGVIKNYINPIIGKALTIEGILITMVDYRTNYAKDITAMLRENYGMDEDIGVLQTFIPFSVKIQEASSEGISLFRYAPKCKTAESFSNLTKEVLGA